MIESRAAEVLVVRREDTPLIGISGHELATLPAMTEVSVRGERGPYTIAAWHGRTGFVLTDHLADPQLIEEEEEEAAVEEVAEQSSTLWPRLVRIMAGVAALAGGAGGVAYYLVA